MELPSFRFLYFSFQTRSELIKSSPDAGRFLRFADYHRAIDDDQILSTRALRVEQNSSRC